MQWKRQNIGISSTIERGLQYLEGLYFRAAVGNRSENKQRGLEFRTSVRNCFTEEMFQEYWETDLLVVDPTIQRRGAGSALMKWVLEQAKEEGCCVDVVSTAAGEPLYARLGFQEIDKVLVDPSRGSTSMAAMVGQPEDSEVDWVGRARAVRH